MQKLPQEIYCDTLIIVHHVILTQFDMFIYYCAHYQSINVWSQDKCCLYVIDIVRRNKALEEINCNEMLVMECGCDSAALKL